MIDVSRENPLTTPRNPFTKGSIKYTMWERLQKTIEDDE